MTKTETNEISFDVKGTSAQPKHKILKTVLITIAAYTIIFNAFTLGYFNFYDINSHNYGISFLLRGKVYDIASHALCILNVDENGAIPNIKIPFTTHGWITFEVD